MTDTEEEEQIATIPSGTREKASPRKERRRAKKKKIEESVERDRYFHDEKSPMDGASSKKAFEGWRRAVSLFSSSSLSFCYGAQFQWSVVHGKRDAWKKKKVV
jgi:hypothetical protein